MKNYEGILLALTRPCPRCGSASGEPCKTRNGKSTAPHKPRQIGN